MQISFLWNQRKWWSPPTLWRVFWKGGLFTDIENVGKQNYLDRFKSLFPDECAPQNLLQNLDDKESPVTKSILLCHYCPRLLELCHLLFLKIAFLLPVKTLNKTSTLQCKWAAFHVHLYRNKSYVVLACQSWADNLENLMHDLIASEITGNLLIVFYRHSYKYEIIFRL